MAKNRKCKFEGCEKLLRVQNKSGFCNRHYRLDWIKKNDILPTP